MSHRIPLSLVFVIGALSLVSPIDRCGAQEEIAPEKKAADDFPAVQLLRPLFQQLLDAESTRATIELAADTIVDGAVINTQKSVYQVASRVPDQFTIYLKDGVRSTRVYCDGKTATVALSPTAFANLDKPIPMRRAVVELPLPMGPYPEAVLALTLAGVDPAFTLTTGMKSVKLTDRNPFRGRTPAIHFSGVQNDDVKWDLWITQDAKPKPLRLLVDLTEMLRANGGLEMPEGYRYTLRFDFKTWLIDQANSTELFSYKKPEDAKQYESIQAYFDEQKD
jgi:hypothetical protein